MGSTGTGRFSDYPGSSEGSGSGAGGGGSQGGGKSSDKCESAIGELPLEEVATCEYFEKSKDVPSVGTEVKLKEELVGGRLAVVTNSKEVVGFLPTKYNYLLKCIKKGFTYVGVVLSSNSGELPTVKIDLGPE